MSRRRLPALPGLAGPTFAVHDAGPALEGAPPGSPTAPSEWEIGGATLTQLLMAAPLSLFAGLVSGLVGFGSGIISIQGMVRLPGFRLTQLAACASSLSAQAFSSFTGGSIWMRGGCCDFSLSMLLSLCGLPGVFLGARLATVASECTLRLAFATTLCCVIVPLTFLQLLRKSGQAPSLPSSPLSVPPAPGDGEANPVSPSLKKPLAEDAEASSSLGDSEDDAGCKTKQTGATPMRCLWSNVRRLLRRPVETGRHCIVGLLVGLLTGSIGVGDTPVLIAYLVNSGFGHREATGTAIIACVPTITFGAIIHTFEGNTIPALVPILISCMSFGASAGAKLSTTRLSEDQLKLGFGMLVLGMGLFVGWEALNGSRA